MAALPATFRHKLQEASERNRSLLCIGLDPDPARLGGRDIFDFGRAIVDATVDLVCAYKPNLAFYEAHGPEGYRALDRTVRHIDGRVPVLADAKRNDIGNSARFYAKGIFETFGFDAVTVNPYLGFDSLEPFLEYADRGVFILCRTSNPGAQDLQDLPVEMDGTKMPFFEAVALQAKRWDSRGNVGIVVGATYPEEAGRVRHLCPDMPFLVPGVGAQQGELEATLDATLDARGEGVMINISRGVIYASDGLDFADTARQAAQDWRARIEARRGTP